jgi:hypothetical protein
VQSESKVASTQSKDLSKTVGRRTEARKEWNKVVSTKNMRQIESKQSKNDMPQKMLIWSPFATFFRTSLPQSEFKVASTQSKQGSNKWGVEAKLPV